MHSALDCIADIDHDPQAALTNGMLALRSIGKLNEEPLSLEVKYDLSRLMPSLTGESQNVDPLIGFGPLWSRSPPDWYCQL